MQHTVGFAILQTRLRPVFGGAALLRHHIDRTGIQAEAVGEAVVGLTAAPGNQVVGLAGLVASLQSADGVVAGGVRQREARDVQERDGLHRRTSDNGWRLRKWSEVTSRGRARATSAVEEYIPHTNRGLTVQRGSGASLAPSFVVVQKWCRISGRCSLYRSVLVGGFSVVAPAAPGFSTQLPCKVQLPVKCPA